MTVYQHLMQADAARRFAAAIDDSDDEGASA